MEFYLELLFTAILSVLLAALLGHLFSVAAADDDAADCNPRPTARNSGGGERRGNVSPIPDRSDFVVKCEEEKGYGVGEARSGEISAKESRDEVKIESFDGDLAESEGRADEGSGTIEKVVAFFGLGEGTSSVVDDVRETREIIERELLEEEKELQFGVERELVAEARVETKGNVEAFLVEGFGCGDNVVGSTGHEIERIVNELDSLERNNYVREMCEVRGNEFLEEANEVDAHRIGTEAKVGKADLFIVTDDECGEDVVRLRGEEVVLKEQSESEVSRSANDEKGQSLLGDEDEWEGVERTELEKQFHEAAAYVGTEGGEFALSSHSDDEQMQLYGLRKVAMEGPCYDPQPMALKVSARAKWHAWERLGNMNPDAAMEQYMSLLSEKVPGWMGENPEGDFKMQEAREVVEPTLSGTSMPTICLNVHSQLSAETERQECASFINDEIESATTDHAGKGTVICCRGTWNRPREDATSFQ